MIQPNRYPVQPRRRERLVNLADHRRPVIHPDALDPQSESPLMPSAEDAAGEEDLKSAPVD